MVHNQGDFVPQRILGNISAMVLNQQNFAPQGTLGNVWRHFCLLQLEKCYWHLVVRG